MDLYPGDSALITFTLKDASGADIPAASVSTLTLTIRDVATQAIINSRDGQSIKNTNGGTLVDGGGTVALSPADNTCASDTVERHVVVITMTASGSQAKTAVETIVVRPRP